MLKNHIQNILKNKTKVALKTISSDIKTPLVAESLKYEFESLRKLNHPNIGSVYDFGKIEGKDIIKSNLSAL